MADEGAADVLGGDDGVLDTSSKKGGIASLFSGLLKWILIGIAAVILIVTVAVIVFKIMDPSGTAKSIPISEEYRETREELEWYRSIEQIRTQTSDLVPASVTVTVAIGYKKDDKRASSEITARQVEIIDFLRRYFAECTVEDLKPANEDVIKLQIKDQINEDILTSSSIRDIKFTQKDVIQQ